MREHILTIGPDTTMNTMTCPCCGSSVDGMAQVVTIDDDGVEVWSGPHDGCVSVCMTCAGLSVMDNGALRYPTPEERSDLDHLQPVVMARVGVIMTRMERA